MRRRMKVAFVSQPFDAVVPPFQNSIGLWTYEVARRLARSCDVIVYTRRDHLQKKVECREGVQYRRMSIPGEPLNFSQSSGFHHVKRPFFASKQYCLGYISQVAKDVRAKQCDIVHVYNFSQFIPVIRAFNPKTKIVLNMRCEWLTQLDRAIIEPRLRKVDLVIGCSEYITEKIRCRFSQFATRCQTVHNGVDIDLFAQKNGLSHARKKHVKRLLFVGRISPEKGVHFLLDAFQKVVVRYSTARLEIVGPGGIPPIEFIVALTDDPKVSNLASFYRASYMSQLQDRLASSVSSQVSFVGYVPHSQLVNHYRNADVLVNPSLTEAFGMSLIEAMACQVPIVATRVGGMPEIVEDGKTGLLVEPGNADELADAILRLLSDEDLRTSMGKVGRLRAVELFSLDRIAENLLCQYTKNGESDE